MRLIQFCLVLLLVFPSFEARSENPRLADYVSIYANQKFTHVLWSLYAMAKSEADKKYIISMMKTASGQTVPEVKVAGHMLQISGYPKTIELVPNKEHFTIKVLGKTWNPNKKSSLEANLKSLRMFLESSSSAYFNLLVPRAEAQFTPFEAFLVALNGYFCFGPGRNPFRGLSCGAAAFVLLSNMSASAHADDRVPTEVVCPPASADGRQSVGFKFRDGEVKTLSFDPPKNGSISGLKNDKGEARDDMNGFFKLGFHALGNVCTGQAKVSLNEVNKVLKEGSEAFANDKGSPKGSETKDLGR